MEAVAEKLHSLEKYFDFCETHEGRFEFVNGEIIEMSGESVTANQIAGNIHFYIRGLLQDQPFIFIQNSVKIQVREGAVFRIPDFFLFKESGNQIKYATEPLLIVEVISEGTEKIDRIIKLNEYRSLQSLQYYLIVEQDNYFVEIYIREGDRWYVEFYEKMDDVITLTHFNIELPLSAVYKKISFPKEP
ncbi:Uma2 family endonuclease [Dyadobacter diqingensis]|uniref:Uma2 family endonuclease n=1 Tax=Dyadobacter diqingensis TaxID=2938121 RepID=UPI0020C34ADD|nr:Uma2 family endonuclease [Dyadobacter diqingensis]